MEDESYSQLIVRKMNTDLKFIIDDNDILPLLLAEPNSIRLTIHIDKQKFYYNFFHHISRQIQLLIALGDREGAEFLLISTKEELCAIVKKATQSSHTIVFFIPMLEDSVSLN